MAFYDDPFKDTDVHSKWHSDVIFGKLMSRNNIY